MDDRSPTIDQDEIIPPDSSIDGTPWGIYVPPARTIAKDHDITNDDVAAQTKFDGGGYIRVVNARGKSFPCAFSRPIGSVAVSKGGASFTGKKRRRQETPSNVTSCAYELEDKRVAETTPTITESQKVTITEERIHPEEALFLHMRGLFSVSLLCKKHDDDRGNDEKSTRLSTQELFCIMLPECKISLAAYLAYAHLRAQGYILTRYSDRRINLLSQIQRSNSSLPLEKKTPQDTSYLCSETIVNVDSETNLLKEQPKNDDCSIPENSSWKRSRTRPLRLLLSDDVANAPPPCVVPPDDNDAYMENPFNPHLAYFAYNPNAHFKRSNPGLPDFGVAVLPFRVGPTFNILHSLVSLVDDSGREENTHGIKSGIPLRVVTVADGGAVIAFSVTHGDVPSLKTQT